MDGFTHPPQVSVTAPGICHNLPLSPTPAAGEPALVNGVPVAPWVIGHLATGEPVTLRVTSFQYLDDLEGSLRVLRGRLRLWHCDLEAHPLGEDESARGAA